MAHNKAKIFENAKKLIVEKHLFFVKDIVGLIGISNSSFYELFPAESDEMEAIKELIQKERSAMCVQLRAKMFKSKSDTATIALYKLICSDDERKILSNQAVYEEHKDEGSVSIQLSVTSFVREKKDGEVTSSETDI